MALQCKNNFMKNNNSTKSSNQNNMTITESFNSLLNKNSHLLIKDHHKICLCMRFKPRKINMQLKNRGKWRSSRDSKKRQRERRRWKNKRNKNKHKWPWKVKWRLTHSLLFRVGRANFRWFQISYNKRRRKYSKIRWT